MPEEEKMMIKLTTVKTIWRVTVYMCTGMYEVRRVEPHW
jgi:hypothetical protein